MTITAKFASTCPTCGEAITPGQQVEWERGGGKARHTDCGATSASTSPAPAGPRAITVERVGRRSYLRGDTYSVRGMLRGAGCHWDADAKAWWIGSQDEALALCERAKAAPAEVQPAKSYRPRHTHCRGCGGLLDTYQQAHGYRFCSLECKMGGQSGYVGGSWVQGIDD